MTATNEKLAKMIRSRLVEIDVERDKLVSLLGLYTNGVTPTAGVAKPKINANGDGGGGFQRRSGGPTDRLLEAVRESPGLSYGDVVDKALEGMETDAEHPRRSLGSTLGSLVKRGKIRRSDDKKYYPAADT